MSAETWLVLITALGVIVSSVLTIRAQHQAEKHHRALTGRAEAAAALQVDQSREVIDALQELAGQDFAAGSAPAASMPGVRWELAHHGGDTYVLTNTGGELAQQVNVLGHHSLRGPNHVQGGPNLGPGEALTFTAARSLATSDSTITVTWLTAYSQEGYTWRYPLPPRPPKRPVARA